MLEGFNEQHGDTKPISTVQGKMFRLRAMGEEKSVLMT